jgi:hypothetical protein
LLASLKALEAAVFLRGALVHARIERHDADRLETVAPADLVVVEVVAGRDLYRSRAELGVDVVVGDDRDRPAGERQYGLLAHPPDKARVLRVHRHREVAEHGLGPHRGHADRAAAVLQRIADRPDAAVFLLGVDFEVGHRGAEHWVPVHQPLAAIDEFLFKQLNKHLHHGA